MSQSHGCRKTFNPQECKLKILIWQPLWVGVQVADLGSVQFISAVFVLRWWSPVDSNNAGLSWEALQGDTGNTFTHMPDESVCYSELFHSRKNWRSLRLIYNPFLEFATHHMHGDSEEDSISICFWFLTLQVTMCLHVWVFQRSHLASPPLLPLHRVVIGQVVMDVTQQVDVKQWQMIKGSSSSLWGFECSHCQMCVYSTGGESV